MNTTNRPKSSGSGSGHRSPSNNKKKSGYGARRSSATHSPTSRRGGSSSYKGKSSSRFSGSKSHRSGGGNRSRSGGGRKMPSFNPSQFINKNPVELKEEIFVPTNTFDTFGLNNRLVSTVKALGITVPSPIQDKIIPEILKGRDVVGLAETGTGKTAAFLLPLIEKTIADKSRQTLILAPTRELAMQIDEELKKLARSFKIHSVMCVGGLNIRPQMRALRSHNQFIIGTPGRIMDLMNRKCFDPLKITTVVLDEADRMLDMGFINDMRTILSATPKERETLFFSATMSDSTEKLVHDFLRNPVSISVKKKDVTNSIEQDVVSYEQHTKFDTLTKLLSSQEFTRVIIFGSMKHSVEKLARELSQNKISAESIHGNKNHRQRQDALQKFKKGEVRVLVATDVAARGIHVDNVSHVINYDLPQTFDDYVHRIGRTGRADNRGKALTFVARRNSNHRR